MRTQVGLLMALSLMFFSLSACDKIFPTPINEIIKSPRDYAGKEVMISGEVIDIFSILIVKYFLIRDDTGEIMVVTDRPLPTRGENIKVQGTVEEAFSIGDQQLIVLIESSEGFCK